MTNKVIYELAILGRATWNLHSLNNEGTVGNVTEPRVVVLADGTKTDGISGEMLKHMHTEKMWALESSKENFCEACRQCKPERADGNQNVRDQKSPDGAIKEALNCELCDIHGFLVQKPTVARPSLIEFGWALGIHPIHKDIHTHARHSVHEQFLQIDEEKEENKWDNEKCSIKECITQQDESKLYKIDKKWYCEEHLPVKTAQMVYHRPTRSGIYAIISVFQPWKIGLNNVNLQYDIDEEVRRSRYELALKAYQAMFLRIEGAMTTTRLPHTEDFKGVIVVSKINYPAPVISPLKDDYITQLEEICTDIGNNTFEAKKFDNLQQFTAKIRDLMKYTPYKLQLRDAIK
ncbi:MAG: DevR family CRISPR-associated autoregulator [Candidatus Thermoplasmatota archaeon]